MYEDCHNQQDRQIVTAKAINMLYDYEKSLKTAEASEEAQSV